MRSMKRRLAIFLAVLLIIPVMPVSAEEMPVPTPVITEDIEKEDMKHDSNAPVEEGEQPEKEEGEEALDSMPENTEVPSEPGASLDTSEEEEDAKATPAPEASGSPVPTTAPEINATPGATLSPSASTAPEAATSPSASTAPEAATSPSASTAPEAATSPSASTVPEAATSPTVSASPQASATPSATPLLKISEADEILFNTGNHAWSVVTKEAFDQEMGDGYYEEDGSYTINIPEENPFFPYEVQFTCEGEVTNQWFMTPDDSVEVGGHTFFVSAHFDGTAVTQMNLTVAGDTIIVWPEEKEFTEDGDGTMESSLLPLTERTLYADLSGYTPAELTMVSASEVFSGPNALADTDKIVWKYSSEEDDYSISASGDRLDLSVGTYSPNRRWNSSTYTYTYYTVWEMIVGEADQLAAANIRYRIELGVTKSDEWLSSTVYTQDSVGNRKEIFVRESDYNDYWDFDDRHFYVYASSKEIGEESCVYVNLNMNPSVFGSTRFDSFKIYEGKYTDAAEAMTASDITGRICCTDMTQANAGYQVEKDSGRELTMVTFAGGNATGCLPFELRVRSSGNYISRSSMFERTASGRNYVEYISSSESIDGCIIRTITLNAGYPVDGTYYQIMSYYKAGSESSSAVTAAYVGQYSSIAEAVSKGATDVKGSLFDNDYNTGGYCADYSQGVYFTIFVGADGTADQEIYRYCIKTAPYEPREPSLGTGTYVEFYGLNDSKGDEIESFVVDGDSYGENNFVTILVNNDADLTNLAPLFNISSGATLHVEGGSTVEVSGESFHDFSGGPIQYGVASEDQKNARQYWLKVMKVSDGAGQLYINSLEDPESNTRVENGIIYSTRQMLLDSYHDYEHHILVVNRGMASIPSLRVELNSDVVELDEYWTLSGNHELSGFGAIAGVYDEKLSNIAKLRIKAKEGVTAGSDVTGTLTFKSGNTVLMELELTGTVGDPCITTETIPEAVKYVPYGPLLMSNNKYYSWNKVSFCLEDGVLPGGVEVKQNGEIYGVPTEAGDFTFTVRMDNSSSLFDSSYKTYTLSVHENTDPNVDGATDAGYNLSQRVQNITASSLSGLGGLELPAQSRTMVSEGTYAEFEAIFLDGEKLVEGTDYTSESGSTRITILTQTLARRSTGTHTLGVEFRTGDMQELRRAAQNYVVEVSGSGDSGDDGHGGGDGGTGGNSDGESSDQGDNGSTAGTARTTANGANAGAGGSTVLSSENSANTVIYTVEAGDSLWKIAEKFYGDGSFWRKIYAENASVIGSDPNKIRVGMVLTIYLNQGDGSMITSVAADGTAVNTYIVQRGDTLWKIALKVYGRSWRWRKIFEANTDKINDPGQIYVGQVLFIPE